MIRKNTQCQVSGEAALGSHLVAVVAGVLLLAAVPGDVAGAVTLVTAVLLLATLSGKVAEPVALVALLAATASTAEATSASSTSTAWREERGGIKMTENI